MQDASSDSKKEIVPKHEFPRDVLWCIWQFLPRSTQREFEKLNRYWREEYKNFRLYTTPKNNLLEIFDPKSASNTTLRVVQEYLQFEQIEKNKDSSDKYYFVLYILMVACIYDIDSTKLSNIRDFIKAQKSAAEIAQKNHQYAIAVSYNLDFLDDLQWSMFMTAYAKKDVPRMPQNHTVFRLYADKKNPRNRYYNFNGGDLSGLNLSGLKFRGDSFIKTNLSRADLSNTDVRNANCSEANLESANLTGTDFAGTNLTGADFNNVKGIPAMDQNTILIGAKNMPQWLEKETRAKGAIFTLKQLAERMRDQPQNFSEALFLKAFKILLKKEIKDDCPEKIKQVGQSASLKGAKRSILQEFYKNTKECKNINTLFEAINSIYDISKQKWRETTEENGKIVKKEISGAELLTRKGGFWGNSDLVDSAIIDDLKAAQEVILKSKKVTAAIPPGTDSGSSITLTLNPYN